MHTTDHAGTPFSQSEGEWAVKELASVMSSGQSIRLKALIAEGGARYEDILRAVLYIAKGKCPRPVALTAQEATDALFGWVLKNPDLAHAYGVLSGLRIDSSEIAPFPSIIGESSDTDPSASPDWAAESIAQASLF